MNHLIFIIIGIVIIIVLFSSKDKFLSKNKHEKELLSKCMGNKAAVDRLISYELKRNPNLTREAAAEIAGNRITRDNS